MTGNKEPKILSRGKKFHKAIQGDWEETAEGEVTSEKTIKTSKDKKGRVDIFTKVNDSYIAIAEIKNSDWDAMTPEALRRNVKRQLRQVWKYIDSQLNLKIDVTPGIIFPKRPKDIEILKLIETQFEEEGISVVWDDESIQERKSRS